VRPLRSTHHEQSRRRRLGHRRGTHLKEFAAHRIAGDEAAAAEERQGLVVRHGGGTHDPREQAIRQTGHGVLLEDKRRDPAKRRDQHDGPRAEAADTDDDSRPAPRHQHPGVPYRRHEQRRAARPRQPRFPFQPGAPD
jgi:hypothetical protein